MIEPEIRQFSASDGYRLHFRHWRPPSDARPPGYVVVLHGVQSHSGWYTYSSSRLCEAGYDVRFIDRRGSGLNQERRGHAPHADRLINDVVQFLAEVRHERNCEAPASPVVLAGVSWGGKLAVVTAACRPELVDALALLYPGICARVRPQWWQRLGVKLLEAVGRDRFEARIPLDDPALFTGQAGWQQYIRDDPLALHRATVSFFRSSSELDRRAAAAPERIRCPVLCLLAGRDRIIDNGATRRYCQRFASTHCELIEYPLAQHTLEFEPDRDRIFDDMLKWLCRVRCAT